MAHPLDAELTGRQLGEFVLRDRLDEGGFAAVYVSEQTTIRRPVVVKVLHRRVVDRDDAALARFVREAQLASRLDHPFAVQVFTSGYEPDGLLWIAMELVQGVSLRRWLARYGAMSLDRFVPFFERVCQVVHAAHERGIVHRDLKPDNIMVQERGGELWPKLLDFGVAKMLDEVGPAPDDFARGTEPRALRSATIQLRLPRGEAIAERSAVTSSSTVVGTAYYIAPELWINPLRAGRASDLYALGVIAYEALNGRKPFRVDPGRKEDDVLIALARQHRHAPVPSVAPGLPPGLDDVFAQALAKRPEHRYPSALELAAALRTESDARLVAQIRTSARQWEASGHSSSLLWRDEILAALESWADRTSATGLSPTDHAFIDASREAAALAAEARARRIRRGRRAAIGASLAMASAVVAFFLYRAAMVAQLASQRAVAAEQVSAATALAGEVEQGRAALLHDELAEAQTHLGEAWRRGDHSPGTAFMLARALQPLRAELARLPAVSGRMWSASFSPDGRQIVTADDRTAQIWDAETHQLLFALPHTDTVYDARWIDGGRRVVTACGDGAVRIWSAETGSLVRELPARNRALRLALEAATPDSRVIAAIDARGAMVMAWDAAIGIELAEIPLEGAEWLSLAFSADGRWLAAGGGNDVRVFDTRTWRRVATLDGPGIHAIAWDPTGPRLVTGSTAGDASIWDVPAGSRARHLRDVGAPVDAVAVSPDGRLVALGGRDGSEQVFDATSGQLTSAGNHLRDRILSIKFDARSELLVAAGADGTGAISEALTGLPVAVLSGPAAILRTARFDPEARRVVGASWDGTARIWDARAPYQIRLGAPIAEGCGLIGGASPDGRVVAIACLGHRTHVWDTGAVLALADLPPVSAPVGFEPVFPAVAPDGTMAVVARGNAAELYTLPGGWTLHTVVHRAAVTAVGLGPGGEIVSGAADGSVLLTRRGEDPAELPPASAGVDAIALVDQGRTLVADARGRLRIVEGVAVVADLAMPARIRLLRPSPDGRVVLAVPSSLGAAAPAALIDLDRRAVIARLIAPPVFAARWVDGGRSLLTAHADGTARLWDADGTLRRTFHGGTQFLADADADGSIVVGGGGDGLLRFWDIQSGRPLWSTPAHTPQLLGVRIDGGDVVTRGSDGSISRWHLPDPDTVIEAGNAGISAALLR